MPRKLDADYDPNSNDEENRHEQRFDCVRDAIQDVLFFAGRDKTDLRDASTRLTQVLQSECKKHARFRKHAMQIERFNSRVFREVDASTALIELERISDRLRIEQIFNDSSPSTENPESVIEAIDQLKESISTLHVRKMFYDADYDKAVVGVQKWFKASRKKSKIDDAEESIDKEMAYWNEQFGELADELRAIAKEGGKYDFEMPQTIRLAEVLFEADPDLLSQLKVDSSVELEQLKIILTKTRLYSADEIAIAYFTAKGSAKEREQAVQEMVKQSIYKNLESALRSTSVRKRDFRKK